MKYVAFALLAWWLPSAASAQDCMSYPAGPAQARCLGKKDAMLAKRGRCKQEAENMGLRPHGGGGALKGYIEACMRRR